MPQVPILLIIPTPFEAGLLQNRLLSQATLPVERVICGIGADQAHAAVSQALQSRSYAGLLIAGFCGGLAPATSLGSAWEVVLPEESSAALQRRLQDWPITEQSAQLPTARLLTTDTVISTAKVKQQLYAETGAELVDMETAAIAALADQYQLPWRGIRAVSDTAEQTLPLRALNAGFDPHSQRSTPLKLLTSLLRHPADLIPFISFVRPLGSVRKALTRAIGDALGVDQ